MIRTASKLEALPVSRNDRIQLSQLQQVIVYEILMQLATIISVEENTSYGLRSNGGKEKKKYS